MALPLMRILVDTNVLFEGLTKQGGAPGLIIDAWLAGLIEVYVSNALAYEYEDVLSRKLSEHRWQRLKSLSWGHCLVVLISPLFITRGDLVRRI